MGIKFFISISQMLMPFFLGLAVGSAFGYNGLLYAGGIAIAVLGVLCIFAPLPAASESGKKESLLQNIKNAHWTAESIALIAIGFTSTATFQLWLNCAQTFAKEIAGVPSEEAAIMQTYYSVGTFAALIITAFLITKFKQVRFLVIYPAICVATLIAVYMIRTPAIRS